MKCTNCFGTGTVWPGRYTLTVRAAKPCPVCKGTCKLPKAKQ